MRTPSLTRSRPHRARPPKFSGALASDVRDLRSPKSVDGKTVPVGNVFEDPARVTMRGAEDPGVRKADRAVANQRDHVHAISRHVSRADGRSVSGVDVPCRFDGGMTMTVAGGQETTENSSLSERKPGTRRRSGRWPFRATVRGRSSALRAAQS